MKFEKKMGIYLNLFFTMFKIGAFTFGGGYAMIALLENEFITRKKWIEKDEFLDMVAISESTPGPIAINSATYLGYKIGGMTGAICATFGMVIPSFIIIFMISLFFDEFLSLAYVGYAFKGIQVCVIYLILFAGIKMLKELEKNRLNMLLVVLVTGCMLTFSVLAVDFSSIFYILICGIIGVVIYLLSIVREKAGKLV